MALPLLAVLFGLALLIWSADRFVDGAAAAARLLGMPTLLIGMVIIGFGTSAPEMVVSALSAYQGNPGIALGNAYGSNIANIALILGVTAVISPLAVQSGILRRELPILVAITALAAFQLFDGEITRLDAWILLGVFALLMGWTIYQGLRGRGDPLEEEMADVGEGMTMGPALFWLIAGMILLVVASRFVVWGAVEIAQAFGVSDLIIGLTIIAIGTSLPELASSITASRKGEHDLALGNVLGSNLFNTLAVVGIAGAIHPMQTAPEVLTRDMSVTAGLTLSLFLVGYGFRGRPGRINRVEGAGLLLIYVAYMSWLAYTMVTGQG